jgi:hypothetical protein
MPMRRLMFASLVCVLGILVMSMRANAAPARLHIDSSSIRNVDYTALEMNRTVIGLRLQRGLTGHGHINNFRVVRLTAYNKKGTIIATRDKRIGKRQTYVHMDVPPAFAGARDITLSLQ